MASTLNLLAFDLGASNGRAIIGKYNGDRIILQEIHKFENAGVNIHGHLYWDILDLFKQIRKGLGAAVTAATNENSRINSLAIDTWGVDYGLLDRNDNLLANVYHYRDKRTDNLLEKIFKQLPKEEIYGQTGIQFMQINTLVQLYADKLVRPWILNNAEALLFIPDLLNFFLTGKKYNEYTNSSTSQLFNPSTNSWADEIFTKLELPRDIMRPIIYPGNELGMLTANVKHQVGIDYDIPVIAAGSHDTASAVVATPLTDSSNSVYISSGTWSLLGMELSKPVINHQSQSENFTNECGVGKKIRFLKNISGLWLIQECRRSWQRDGLNLTYDQISQAAAAAPPLRALVDPDDPRFLNPQDMPQAIRDYCQSTNQPVPEEYGEVARCVYESLAASYATTITKLEQMIGTKIETIHMVGGGIQAEILCQFTANATGRKVITGPVEATAMGNIVTQLMAIGEIKGLAQARQLIRRSTKLKEYLPA